MHRLFLVYCKHCAGLKKSTGKHMADVVMNFTGYTVSLRKLGGIYFIVLGFFEAQVLADEFLVLLTGVISQSMEIL